MDPFLEQKPQWKIFHGWFIRKLAEQHLSLARELDCVMDVDLLRGGDNPARDRFPELPAAPYFVFVARKTSSGRQEEAYALRLQDPLPTIGLPLGGGRPDLPLDLAATFRAAYDLSYRPNWGQIYQQAPPPPALTSEDQNWVDELLQND